MAPQAGGQAGGGKVFSCYLLRSASANGPGRTYIGFTVNPLRRLRQHNGEIKGGARKTSRWKPWELVLVVHGFSNKIVALQFEYAWQHPERSRLLRAVCVEHVPRRRGASLEAKMVVLLLALRTAPFSSQPLGVHLFDGAAERRHFDARLHARLLMGEMHLPEIPLHMVARLTRGDAAECFELSRAAAADDVDDDDDDDDADAGEDEGSEDGGRRAGSAGAAREVRGGAEASGTGAAGCALCGEAIVRAAVACACGLRAHPVCLASRFLPAEEARALIPTGGSCPRCGAHAYWPDLVRRGGQLRSHGQGVPRARAQPSAAAATHASRAGGAGAGGAGTAARARPSPTEMALDIDLAGDSSGSEAEAAGAAARVRVAPAELAFDIDLAGDSSAGESGAEAGAEAEVEVEADWRGDGDGYGDGWQSDCHGWDDDARRSSDEAEEHRTHWRPQSPGARSPDGGGPARAPRSPLPRGSPMATDELGQPQRSTICGNLPAASALDAYACEEEGDEGDEEEEEGSDEGSADCYDMRPLAERLSAWPLDRVGSASQSDVRAPQPEAPPSFVRSPRATAGFGKGASALAPAAAAAACAVFPLAPLGLSRSNAIVVCSSDDDDL